jgi:putative ABC transport system permease protein
LREIVGEAGPYRVRTYVEAQEELQGALARAADFLGLVALLSLLLGGLGIAQTTRAWLQSRMDDVAILRCLGLRPGEVLALYLGQTALLAIVGSAIGVGLGVLIQALVPRFAPGILDASQLHLWQPLVFLRGLLLGLGVALLFSIRALLSVRSVPPLRVLRKDVEPLPHGRWATSLVFLILGIGIWSVATIQSSSVVRGLQFTLALILAALLLAGIAWLLMRSLAPPARKLDRLWLRQGILALARPGAATLGAIVSLGIGVLLILGLELVRDRLANQLRHELPPDAPTAFLVNIQPDQWPAVERLLIEQGADQVTSVPVVTARLRTVDGQSTSDLVAGEEEGDRRWALTREQRLTYLDELPADNVVLSGSLWADDGAAEVSVEEEFARELGVEVGSRLTFDVQGVPVELLVSSIRSVEWTSFGINFYLVVEPGVLEEAPHQRVATARLPAAREQPIQDRLAERFPNITLLKMREILERLALVLGFLARGVSFIGGFTAIAGIVILAGGISADSVRRRRHIALLKTLGMTRLGIAAMLAVEFTAIGLVAGLIGVGGGNLLSWVVITRGMELDWQLQPLPQVIALTLAVLLTAATGILSCRRALQQPPAVILRGD